MPSSDAFHAASNNPSASQLSVASRRCGHHVARRRARHARSTVRRRTAIDVPDMSAWFAPRLRLRGQCPVPTADSSCRKSGESAANCGESWRARAIFNRRLAIGFDSRLSAMIASMKKQIAIVEDEPALRENYAAALARHGYSIKTYGNRKTAMQAFKPICRISPSSTFRSRTRPKAASISAATCAPSRPSCPSSFSPPGTANWMPCRDCVSAPTIF